MASGWTNRGRLRTLQAALANTYVPASFRLFLCTPATTPTAGVDTLAALTQIADGNGYNTSGYTLARDTTDWDTMTESDTGNSGFLKLKDIVWTAAGGTLPSAGSGARWAALGRYTSTLANTEIYYWWDLVSERTVSVGQTLTLQDCTVRAKLA